MTVKFYFPEKNESEWLRKLSLLFYPISEEFIIIQKNASSNFYANLEGLVDESAENLLRLVTTSPYLLETKSAKLLDERILDGRYLFSKAIENMDQMSKGFSFLCHLSDLRNNEKEIIKQLEKINEIYLLAIDPNYIPEDYAIKFDGKINTANILMTDFTVAENLTVTQRKATQW